MSLERFQDAYLVINMSVSDDYSTIYFAFNIFKFIMAPISCLDVDS